MGFLGALADQINNQFPLGQNNSSGLGAIINGQGSVYQNLGDFASQVDQSAERRYLEDGFLREDPYTTSPKQFETLFQEPNATILIKKSMFSSINENYRPDFMDADEKLYYKTMKVLFQNKCQQISVLEQLSKIQRITSAVGNVSQQLLPIIISLTDSLNSGLGSVGNALLGQNTSNGEISSFSSAVERLRRLYAYNTDNPTTTWITDPTNIFQSKFGQGTGVIEITNFTTFSTSVSVDSIKNPGNFSFTISDPYEAMLITEYDIERAISDATNAYYNNKVFQFGQESSQQIVNDLQTRLTQIRSARGASPISILTNPSTLINANQVVAIISGSGTQIKFNYSQGILGLGSGVNVALEYLKGGAIAGVDGLATTNSNLGIGPDSNIKPLSSQSELSIFKQLISAIYNQITLINSSQSNYVAGNKATNYVRRKLRFQFCGRVIIQPMDIVHIYSNSKSRYDIRLLDGLQSMFTGQGILQNLGQTVFDLQNAATSLFNPSGNVAFQAEKASFVGPDFPNYLWSLLRNQFITEEDGTHIFAGVVETAPYSWSDGKFITTVSGKDNTVYFDMGKVNWKPGVDVFNGAIFDPLTPFKTSFDTITSNAKSETPELLDENKFLLGSSNDGTSPLVKFKLGPNTGLAAREDNIIQDRTIDKTTGGVGKIFYAPDGLVYKWKEGIGTLVQFGNSTQMNDPSLVGAPALTKEPFAGQDVMNVISLLITGQPYNFANYWRAVSNFDGFNRDPQSQQDAAYSYYNSLQTSLQKNNITWGNFIPFKNLSMDEQSFAKAMQGQIRAIIRNQDLDSKVQALAKATMQVNMFAVASVLSTGSRDQQDQFAKDKLDAEKTKDQLASQINAIIALAGKQDQSSFSSVANTGDPSFDSGTFSSGNNPNDSLSDPTIRQLYRRQINNLTRRMSYNVRANGDKNLFIVDDYYDKDYDILAYEQSLADGIKLYNNEFSSVREKIVNAADLLNLEVFADTQGHIRVRPPQYNRMPSSVFYRMLWLKKMYGIQIYPQFLEDIFGDQISSLTLRLEILENQIRLDCAVLGINTDAACTSFITGGSATAGTGSNFGFISNESSFRITDTSALLAAANPDNSIATSLANQAVASKQAFTNTQRYQAILDALTKNKLSQAGYGIQDIPQYASNTRIDSLIQILKTDTGQQIPRDSFLVSNDLIDNGTNIPAGQSIDVFKVTSDLSDKIKNRQQVLKLLYGAIKNSTEAKSLDDDKSTTSGLLNPGIYGNKNIPEIFEHMIEDETYDDYGVGSGTRYVIRRPQIRNVQLAESPPDYTYIEVRGVLNPFAPNALPNDLTSFPQGGNGIVTAAAVDYDLWRKFGFRQQSPINVPFLSDPNSQCAPYASMILSRARKNILRGTVTISGNEFMQPGEVVFLQDWQMLFYVTSVKHNFNYANGFTTTLDIAYGHTPGEYIPTTLDVIGKLIYSNRDISNLTVQRQSNSDSSNNMGVVAKDPSNQGTTVINSGNPDDFVNGFTASNSTTISNILYQAAYMLNANNTVGNNIQASVELRIYFDDNNPLNSDLQSFAGSVKSFLTSPQMGPVQLSGSTSSSSNQTPTLDPNSVSVEIINLDDTTDFRSPSQKAIDMARNLIDQSGNSSANSSDNPQQDFVRSNLFKFVVDCWLTFKPV